MEFIGIVIVLFENDYVMIVYWNQLLINLMVGLCICWFDSYVIDIYYFIGIFVDIYWYVLSVMVISFIELDDGKIYRKTLYLMVKTMVSCRFSLKPTQW